MKSTSSTRRRWYAIGAATLLLLSGFSPATTIPGLPTTPEIRSQQQRAETAFDAGDYDTAMSIYRETLAPKGDKYSQYMLGWMRLNGLGGETDPVLAAAWFALAAERGDEAYVNARDEVLAQLDADETRASTVKAAELIATYGDCTLVKAALNRRQAGIPDPHKSSDTDEPQSPRFGPSDRLTSEYVDPREWTRKLHDMQRYLDKQCP